MIGRIRNYKYKINVKPNTKQVAHTPARTSYENMIIIDKEVEKLKKNGIIHLSVSNYNSRTILVRRADGRPRLYLDFRDINETIERDGFPVPYIQLCIRTARNAKYLTKLYMNNMTTSYILNSDLSWIGLTVSII
jgi:hypothetical protein